MWDVQFRIAGVSPFVHGINVRSEPFGRASRREIGRSRRAQGDWKSWILVCRMGVQKALSSKLRTETGWPDIHVVIRIGQDCQHAANWKEPVGGSCFWKCRLQRRSTTKGFMIFLLRTFFCRQQSYHQRGATRFTCPSIPSEVDQHGQPNLAEPSHIQNCKGNSWVFWGLLAARASRGINDRI